MSSRRRFLRDAALLAGLPLVPVAVPRAARADSHPRRLVIINTTEGTWWPARTFGAFSGPGSFSLAGLGEGDLPELLAPLARHLPRSVYFEGLALATTLQATSPFPHENGFVHAWTGADFDGEPGEIRSHAPSLDQIIGEALSAPGRSPTLGMRLAIKPRAVSWSAEGSALRLPLGPIQLWERLFAGVEGASSSSVVDAVARRYRALAPTVGRSGAVALEAQADRFSDLHARILAARERSCVAAEPPFDSLDPVTYWADPTVVGDLIGSVLACDMTRVFVLSVGDLSPTLVGRPDGSTHLRYAHQVFGDPDAVDAMRSIHTLEAEWLATVLDRLEAVPEDGGSLLDNTLVVWGNELGDGAHGGDGYPAAFFGGAWAHEPGRLVRFERTTPLRGRVDGQDTDRAGLPHHHLMISIARSMGVDIDSFGLTQLTGDDGSTVSLRGGLPEPW